MCLVLKGFSESANEFFKKYKGFTVVEVLKELEKEKNV